MTLDEIFRAMGLVLGFCAGVSVGREFFGPAGTLVSALVFACLGVLVGSIPERWALYRHRHEIAEFLKREMVGEKSVEQLRNDLRDPGTFTVNCHLLELERRGEDISNEIPFVLDMLCDERPETRGRGFAAFLSAYPDLAKQVPDYCVDDPPAECRRKLEPLRRFRP